jgi:hypothetical protein
MVPGIQNDNKIKLFPVILKLIFFILGCEPQKRPLTVTSHIFFEREDAWKKIMIKYCDCNLKKELTGPDSLWDFKLIFHSKHEGLHILAKCPKDTNKPCLLNFRYEADNQYLTTCTDTLEAHIVLREFLRFVPKESREGDTMILYHRIDSVMNRNRAKLLR